MAYLLVRIENYCGEEKLALQRATMIRSVVGRCVILLQLPIAGSRKTSFSKALAWGYLHLPDKGAQSQGEHLYCFGHPVV